MMSNGFSVKIDDRALNRQIEQAIRLAPQETVKAMRECLIDLAANSAKRAPIEMGDLRNDCHATLNNITIFEKQTASGSAPASLKAAGMVGYSLPYALKQHEDLSLSHTRTDGYIRKDGTTVNMVAGGEAKYLERPFAERKERYIRRIAEIVKRCIKK